MIGALPDQRLRKITEEAAEIVDRICPEQAFQFRATLILVSMIAAITLATYSPNPLADGVERS